MVDAAEIARLREIAQKATQGDWSHEPHGDTTALYSDRKPMMHGLRLLNLDDGDSHFAENAAHIAAFDPPTALSLIDELEQARVRIEDLRKANAGMEAERDSARALLQDIARIAPPCNHDLQDRIETELRKQ